MPAVLEGWMEACAGLIEARAESDISPGRVRLLPLACQSDADCAVGVRTRETSLNKPTGVVLAWPQMGGTMFGVGCRSETLAESPAQGCGLFPLRSWLRVVGLAD